MRNRNALEALYDARRNAASLPKAGGTRLLKVMCPEDGYTVRVTRTWLDMLGVPTCPCGTRMEEA